ncbi:30S ribosomal protein S15 [Streptococcus suis]|nr:30S ribosomal protein S15 [Streptococcus suis]CYX10555.1 30S ribosomal protein S15 [Streptococcus suis]
MPALPKETLERCRTIRKAYRELEVKHHDKEWSIEE